MSNHQLVQIKSLPRENISLINSFFAPGGPVSKTIKNFEPRKQQKEMANAVWQSLFQKKHLIVEAGTGVGKSLSYLIPSALWAVKNQKKVIVATYTKALQEQLNKKDLPIVKAILKKSGFSFKYFILMGSANYLCLTRLHRADKQGAELFDNQEHQKTISKILEWSKIAESGCRTEIPFKTSSQVWEEICREPDMCLWKRCAFKNECLYRKDIALAKQADLVVANQHLFFAGFPIPAFDAVIFDEAHNLEEVASNFLGFSITNRKIKRLLDDIYNQKSGKGLAKRLKHPPANWLPEIQNAVSDAHFAARTFFQDIMEKLGFDNFEGKIPSKAKRIRKPNIVQNSLSKPLLDLIELLSDAVGHSQSAEEESEIKAHLKRCLLINEHLNAFLECKGKEHAYWVEVFSKRNPIITLNKAPVDVSESLKKELFEKHCPVLLTSATLSVNNSFNMIKSRIGLDKNSELLLDSPFNYEKQVVFFVPHGIPDPEDSKAYEDAVIKECLKIPKSVKGGILILFTNWHLLEKSFNEFSNSIKDRKLFKQGEKLPQQLLNEFKQDGNGILLATDTFWQGIDVPGTALSCIVITRLPFLSPDTPLEEARHEWMSSKGINVFEEYILPKAIIKFRQGFGRLIRSKTDFGAVIVMDPRIHTKRYGTKFLHSIPKCHRVQSLNEIKEFFKTNGSS